MLRRRMGGITVPPSRARTSFSFFYATLPYRAGTWPVSPPLSFNRFLFPPCLESAFVRARSFFYFRRLSLFLYIPVVDPCLILRIANHLPPFSLLRLSPSSPMPALLSSAGLSRWPPCPTDELYCPCSAALPVTILPFNFPAVFSRSVGGRCCLVLPPSIGCST